jgi:hypothetical protein
MELGELGTTEKLGTTKEGSPEPRIPPWCRKDGWAIHLPDRVVFRCARLQRDKDAGAYYLLDYAGQEYPVADCDSLTLEHLQKPASLAGYECPISLLPHSQGFVVSAGNFGQRFRKRVVVPNEGQKSAESLACFFNGAIYTEDLNAD